MTNQWLKEVKQRLDKESSTADNTGFDRLVAQGIINGQGEVTGHVRRWDAFLAVTAVMRANGGDEIAVFRCLKPVFGMPGTAAIDVRRDSLVAYLKEGKKVVTALWDDRLRMWKEGDEVRLSLGDFVTLAPADSCRDDVGNVPEFRQSASQL